MKALSIRQPWAWMIVRAGKHIENRSWRCHYRGPIAIHASKMPTGGAGLDQVVDDFHAGAAMARAAGVDLSSEGTVTLQTLALESGAIVALADVVDCVTESGSPWFVGPFGIVLSSIRQTAVVPCKGALGLWTVPADVESGLVVL